MEKVAPAVAIAHRAPAGPRPLDSAVAQAGPRGLSLQSAMRSPTTTSPVAIPTRTCSGYCRAGEHDAERAVRAGLALVEAVPKLATVAGSPRRTK